MTRVFVHRHDDDFVGKMKSDEAPIHGDILQSILSHVPLVDLVQASQVSKSWSQAVTSSLNYVNKPKPWLVVHSQSKRAPYTITSHVYDPRSLVWIEVSQPSMQNISTLHSSPTNNLLYMISLTRFSFSCDPLHLTWQHVDAPHVSRTDPVVALMSNFIVVAGGTCEFEDDKLSVEMYNLASHMWVTCPSMPSSYKESGASTWLSNIVVEENLLVMEKISGLTHMFDPKLRMWSQRYYLKPDPQIFYSVLAHSNGWGIILFGLIGTPEKIEAVKLYKVNINDGHIICNEELGHIPLELIIKLKSEVFEFSDLNVCMAGNIVYVYNTAAMDEVLVGEMVEGGGWRWWSLKNEASSDRSRIMKRNVIGCAEVGLEELHRVMDQNKGTFKVK